MADFDINATSSTPFRKEIMEDGKFFEVMSILMKQGLMNPSVVKSEAEWYFFKLGIHAYYFREFSAEMIANHLTQLHAARLLAQVQVNEVPSISVIQETKDRALYFCNSVAGVRVGPTQGVEARIDQNYLDRNGEYFRVLSYRSLSPAFENSSLFLRLQFVERAVFPQNGEMRNLDAVSDKTFISRISSNTRLAYEDVMEKAKNSYAPVVRVLWDESTENPENPSAAEAKVIIAFQREFVGRFFSSLSALYHYYGLTTVRKYVEQLANNITLVSLVARRSTLDTKHLPANFSHRDRVSAFAKDVDSLYVLAYSNFHVYLKDYTFSLSEILYLNAGWKFCYYFLRRFHEDWKSIAELMDSSDPTHVAVINRLRGRLAQSAATERSIFETLVAYPAVVKSLFKHFTFLHCPFTYEDSVVKESRPFPTAEEIEKRKDEVRQFLSRHPFEVGEDSEFDQQVFQCLFMFNNSILKTNFFVESKVALAFRMNVDSISSLSFVDQKPFGYFFFIGTEFRGFHLRFQDMARGGVRIVKSPNREAFNRNMVSLLEENYNLALTQQRKNKDIPEGGSKGTLLLSVEKDFQGKPFIAFQKYVDAMLDILLPDKRTVLDYYGKEEILFLGPDEGTADYMHWACEHARKRGYRFWRAFTTGKPLDLGGIPHDVYGMTTRSVHQYVLGSLKKLGLKEEECTKFQTGGPDGDLGSNEIKISSDKTIAVVDGSGVLVDPEGIHREELSRLAHARKMVSNFDRSKLSAKGYVVLVEDKSVRLPTGEEIESGLAYRNSFHLLPASSATMFVPCGGRPNAVTIQNVDKLFDDRGVPRYRIIVEGANLFYTQAARLRLEQAGVILFKDASANKGGVTSSSLEVLAALAFGDDERFEHLMAVRENEVTPQFYKDYVKYVQDRIEENALLECELIFREHELTKLPHCVLSDKLSEKINFMKRQIFESSLYQNIELRDKILKKSLPPLLLDLLGYEKIVERVPSAYLQSIFATYIAAHFVYRCGLSTTSEFAFYEFMNTLN